MKRKFSGSLGLALVGTLLATPALQSPADAGPPGSVTGTLLNADGRPLVGATVELAVIPSTVGEDAPLVPKTFATTKTDQAGRFSLGGAPAGLSRMAQSDGSIELMVTGISGDQAVHYSTLAEPPADSKSLWTLQGDEQSLPPLELQMGAGEVSGESSGASGASLMFEEGESTDQVEGADDRDVLDPVNDPTTIGGGESTCVLGYSYIWAPTDQYRRRDLPIQRVTTRGHSHMKYEWQTTRNTEMEAVFTGDGGIYGGGELIYSTIQNDGAGKVWNQGNGVGRILFAEWQYRRYQKRCYTDLTGTDTYPLNVFTWRPRVFTGEDDERYEPTPWGCDGSTTIEIGTETWVARSKSVGWSNSFSLAGVGLNNRQMNSTSHRLTVYPDAGEVDPKICGDNGFPTQASKVKERTQ